MKKIVPDPPHQLCISPEKPLARAIQDGLVPMEYVLMNVSHYLMSAFSNCHRALERIDDSETRQLLQLELRAVQIALGAGRCAEPGHRRPAVALNPAV